MQVSGVNINGDLLLLFCSWLLDRLSDQLAGDFVHGVAGSI